MSKNVLLISERQKLKFGCLQVTKVKQHIILVLAADLLMNKNKKYLKLKIHKKSNYLMN